MRVWITGDGLERLVEMPVLPRIGDMISIGNPTTDIPKFRVERIQYTLPEEAPKGEAGQPLLERFAPDDSQIILFV